MKNYFYYLFSFFTTINVFCIQPSDKVKPSILHSQSQLGHSVDNYAQTVSSLTKVVGDGIWKYGCLFSPYSFIAPKNPCWRLGSEVLIGNERRLIIRVSNCGLFSFITLNKKIENLPKNVFKSLKNFEWPSEIGLDYPGLVRLYLPMLTRGGKELNYTPLVEKGEIAGFSNKHTLLYFGSNIKSQANRYYKENKDKQPILSYAKKPWTFFVYASDDNTSQEYTSIYQLLNSLYNAVMDAPDNQVNVVVQTKIPDETYAQNLSPLQKQERLAKRQDLIQYQTQLVHSVVGDVLGKVKGIVRFVLNKKEGQVKIKTQQFGKFSDDLNNLQVRKDFLTYANSLNFPGYKMYCLYAHGRGWQQLGSDGYPLDTPSFAEGLRDQSIDILRLDTCLTQTIETLYELALKNPQLHYVVASQNITPLDSASDTYTRLMPVGYKSASVFDYARQHTQDKVDDKNYNRAYTSTGVVNNNDGIIYSTIDMRFISELKKRIDHLAQTLLDYSIKSQANKTIIINMLNTARLKGTLFTGVAERRTNRTNGNVINDSYFYDLFDIIKIFKEEINVRINDRNDKIKLSKLCDLIAEIRPVVVLENHFSTHSFLQSASGMSIDLSPPEKFNPTYQITDSVNTYTLQNPFNSDYSQLMFSKSANQPAPWYRLLKLQ